MCSGCCACPTRVLRANVGWYSYPSLSTADTHCYPRVVPVDKPVDLACDTGASRIVSLVEPRPFSWQCRYPETLMDIVGRADRFDRCVFCRELELWSGVSREEIYLWHLRIECGMARTSLDDFYVEREQTGIHQ